MEEQLIRREKLRTLFSLQKQVTFKANENVQPVLIYIRYIVLQHGWNVKDKEDLH